MTRCRITGCGLQTVSAGAYWGDLWEEGSCWVFNATSEEGCPVEPEQLYGANIIYFGSSDYFHRRAVFIADKATAWLNAAAWEHISKESA